MSLNESVLYFDRIEVTDEQMRSHVKHYVELAEKGLALIAENNNKEAMACLKEIRKTMSEEYKYYSRSKVQSIMWDNGLYNDYYHFIRDAFVKQHNPNAYKTLRSNLYDVMDYGRYHYREYAVEK
ncbi:hypothetical protein [Bacillus toyonensis]|uniref:hypothetical protein n=1 Tax=Bacillus toyonensis TaxID=155322 RepID=UPI000BEDD69B|nr:hypothetical protein [Bacillus toyonensis]PEF77687.1 hypothetical protein CON80_30195 [Bacillus toyonensis]